MVASSQGGSPFLEKVFQPDSTKNRVENRPSTCNYDGVTLEFSCYNCKKLFCQVLSLVDYEEGEICCPVARVLSSVGLPSTHSHRRRAPETPYVHEGADALTP